MASQQRILENSRSSLKHWWIPLEVQSRKSDLTVLNENLCTPSTSHPKSGLLPDRRSSKGLTISHFRSAASGIWDVVGQPSNFLSNGHFKNVELFEKFVPFQLEGYKTHPKDTEFRTSTTAKSNFEELRRIKKMLIFASCSSKSLYFYSTAFSTGDSDRELKGASIDFFDALARNASKMISKPFFGLKDLTKFTKRGCNKLDESFSIVKVPSDLPGIQIPDNFAKVKDSDLVKKNIDSSKCELKSTSPLYSAHTFHSLKEEMIILKQPASEIQTSLDVSSTLKSEEYQKLLNCTSSVSKSLEVPSATNYQNTCENDKFFGSFSLLEDFSPNPWMAIQNKLQHAFSNNRHAIAGALAGTLVTLCLHPVDTIKTIIQANETGQTSFYQVLRRIVSQHGICGLYRGIASNITSSAPISAIYTFTYESAKCTLLPLLPTEYYSLAHCIAGGCSSLATSFVFTPSECIKQQMQVSAQYQNCWKALIGCLQKGGLLSLYAGWGAVLCRNIPHSIIKFYTYESLKQFISAAYPKSNLKIFHTIVCGGLAGSTAALFTTPFDVVKTRLQTQPPGSLGRYHGVFHALGEIARQEGLQGLYRGLTPRLAMYVSQGAIFFATYEFLKTVFFLETEQKATIEENKTCCDDPAIARLQKLHA